MRTSSSSELGTIPPSRSSPLRFAEWSDEEARADFEELRAEKEREVQELVALPAAERRARLPHDLRRNFAEDADYVRRLHAEAERRAQRMRAPTRAVTQGVRLHVVIHGGRRERRTPSAKHADSTSSDDADPDGSRAARSLEPGLNADEMRAIVEVFRVLHSWESEHRVVSKGAMKP